MKLKNKNIGAKVIIRKILINITPEKGWEYIKNVSGVLVESNEMNPYYYTSSGGGHYPTKHIIKNVYGYKYFIKLDNNITDISGNNILRLEDYDLKFVEYLENVKLISKKEYNKAVKLIEEYNLQQSLK